MYVYICIYIHIERGVHTHTHAHTHTHTHLIYKLRTSPATTASYDLSLCPQRIALPSCPMATCAQDLWVRVNLG